MSDEDMIGAIKFQGALNRKASGQATDSDTALLREYFNTFQSTASQLGFESKHQPDMSHISEGIDAALEELQETLDVAAFVGKVKKLTSAPAKKAQAAPPQEKQDRQQPSNDSDQIFYSRKLVKDWSFLGDEVKDPSVAYQRFTALALDRIRRDMPGTDPRRFFDNLSVSAKYEYLKEEIDNAKVERERKMPRKSVGTMDKPVRNTQSPGKPSTTDDHMKLAAERLANWGR
jgi:hypothetical protein